MRKFIAWAAAGLCLTAGTGLAQAQSAEGLYLGPSVSYYYLSSKRTVSGADDGAVLGFNLGYRFFNDWALEVGVGGDLWGSNLGDDLTVVQANFYYWFGEDRPGWRPYAVAGLSYYERDTDDTNLEPNERYTHQAQLGVGLSRMVAEQLDVRADARFIHKVRNRRGAINDGSINLSANYYFSKPAPAATPVAEPARPVPVAEPEPEMRTITVRINVEFEFDKAVVRALYGDELRAVADAMKAHDDIELVLEGHTDSIGAASYNQDLSERRAAAVKAKLVEDFGIPAHRIRTVGYGEARPIASNDTDEGRQRNRRVVGELSYKEVVPR